MKDYIIMIKVLLGLAFALITTLPSLAQTISGRVITPTGEGLGNVTVTLLNTSGGTVTGADGSFSLSTSIGSYQVSARRVGYAQQIKSVVVADGVTTLNFTLVESTRSLDEVVVTAQRREERLLEAPLSVTSLDAATIEDTRTWELADLNGLIPNYFYGEIGVGFQQVQSIRGISVFSENPAVATYVDGVNQLDILANGFQLVDVESIEVLRGPQGTLFGRNAMGGVINITTRQPTNQTEIFAETSIGHFGGLDEFSLSDIRQQRHAIGFKAPLVEDRLFLGVTALFEDNVGFLTNDTTGAIAPQEEAQGASVGDQLSAYGNIFLKWLPTKQWDLTLNVKGQLDDSDASGFFIYQRTDSLARANPNAINLGRVGEHRRDIINTALSANYYHPSFTLTSTTTFQQIGLRYNNIYDANFGINYGSYADEQIGVRSDPQQVFTQEVKVTSRSSDRRLSYTGGLFFFSQNAFEPTTNIALFFSDDQADIFKNEGQNLGFAAYGQASYRLTEELEFTAGLRYDYERRENTLSNASFSEGQETTTIPDSTYQATSSALSPKIALTYFVNQRNAMYLSYTRGFRPGGVNFQNVPGVDLTFDPEYSDNVEVGFKSSLSENRVFIAATAYYIGWTDLQFFNQVGANQSFLDNVGDATSYGLEFETSLVPIKNLQLERKPPSQCAPNHIVYRSAVRYSYR
ncbi:TonB-dependent receptor [Tunicatimonas pelagia]|uniref:TonB-dependent receptor n=1 Tax=Tunicatimonas pelagia TaxID=931531 RepID=UPI002664F7E9|nr:TonB-dependent receptor [Tunicatimonas pelagia]WKN41906.1 TonB-dependent receptor [Tunicatimonas pelagia]